MKRFLKIPIPYWKRLEASSSGFHHVFKLIIALSLTTPIVLLSLEDSE